MALSQRLRLQVYLREMGLVLLLFCLVFLFTFPVLHFKNRVGSWKSLKGFSQQFP